MSAICGILRFDDGDVAAGAVARMTRRMAHRGPDGIETVELGRLALGHCLMHVNREDLYEAQPIVERDAVLVADLRLDNREALAAEVGIDEDALAAMADSMVLLHAWRRWGDDVAAHLLGDFAFAIFDRAAGTLLIGRDHMGQRQVYYHTGEGFLVFATEIAALFDAGGVPRRINENELARRLAWSSGKQAGDTIYADVALLPGGSALRIDAAGGSTLASYWQPHPGAEHIGRDDSHFIAAYRATIEEAVACRVRRLIAPPALAFSGGFDSGIIADIAGPIVAAAGGKVIAVASVLAEDHPERDARPAVGTFRGRPGLDIHYYVRGTETNYDDPETSFEESGGMSQRNTSRQGIHAIARRGGARLVMDGHGGDYTVNVYDTQWLGAMLKRGDFRRFAREFRAKLRFTGKRPRSALRSDILPSLTPTRLVAWALAAKQGFAPLWRRRALNRDFAARMLAGAVDRRTLHDGHPLGKHGPARMLKILRNTAMGAPGQGSPAARAGLDLTRPFHDKRVVELGLAIPDSLHFRDGRDRWLARTVFADRLPRRMIERQLVNDREQPDQFRMMREAAPRLLAETRALDRDSAISRYIDIAAAERLLAHGAREEVKRDRIRTAAAMRSLMTARFLAWIDRDNS